MKTVLIAEDEKLIRKGLEAMVRRAPVPVDEILTARDGVEAMELLEKHTVDVLITDIRMPRMDGIEMVAQAAALPHPPLTLVVSGYDDFNYAVAMLRRGVSDYLLKPVERQRLYDALVKMEAQLKEREAEAENHSQQLERAMRLIMLEQEPEGVEYQKLVERYEADFLVGPYISYCAGACAGTLPDRVERHSAMGGLFLYVVPQKERERMEGMLSVPAGRSGIHQGLASLRVSYQEARNGWWRSFFNGKLCSAQEPSGRKPLQVTSRQLLGMVGLSWDSEVSKLMQAQAELVAGGEADPEEFAELCREFIEDLCKTYKNFIDPKDDPMALAQPWGFAGIQPYLQELKSWLGRFCTRIAGEFADYENKQKIRQAVQYMQANFREPLNMAVVSNYVSMNYSLFSLLFKQYTGANFVSYLQNLRVKETKRLLETTDWRVNEIGRRVGFADTKHFLKVFKAATGFSPTEYRRARALTERNGEQKNKD